MGGAAGNSKNYADRIIGDKQVCGGDFPTLKPQAVQAAIAFARFC